MNVTIKHAIKISFQLKEYGLWNEITSLIGVVVHNGVEEVVRPSQCHQLRVCT